VADVLTGVLPTAGLSALWLKPILDLGRTDPGRLCRKRDETSDGGLPGRGATGGKVENALEDAVRRERGGADGGLAGLWRWWREGGAINQKEYEARRKKILDD
jgi:hypothetical protein